LEAGRNGIVVACGKGALRILELKPAGKRRMTAREYQAGRCWEPGHCLE
jgi:methionyl-tRNA formyltransferase